MVSSPFGMCPTCRRESKKVRECVLDHPNLSLQTVSDMTNVPYRKVMKMISLGVKKDRRSRVN